MGQMIADSLRTAWLNFIDALAVLLPRILAMLSIVVVGWLIATVLAFLTRRLIVWLKIGSLIERSGAGQLARRSALPPLDALIASLIFWVVWLGFLISGIGALGFPGMDTMMESFVLFVPRLVVGLVLLAVGLVTANFAWRATLLAAVNAQLPSARVLGNGVRALVVALTVAMVLEQIGVAKTVVLTAFAISFGAVMIGLAIAFGIGGGPMARRALENAFPERGKKDGETMSHL